MCKHDAIGHRLAVQERSVIAGPRLQGVGEGMAQIEEGSLAAFALVSSNDSCLGPAGMGHGGSQQTLIAVDQRRTVLFEPGEEFGVVDQAVLHDLGIACPALAQRQRAQRGHVG